MVFRACRCASREELPIRSAEQLLFTMVWVTLFLKPLSRSSGEAFANLLHCRVAISREERYSLYR
jgi:hypothetical protein